MSPRDWKIYILIYLLALYPIHADAVNFTQCFTDVVSCANNASGSDCVSGTNISGTTAISLLRTSNGSPLISFPSSTDVATALSYEGCVSYCGTGQEPFGWTVFSQEYASWLLPYLALLSQLPFGARRRTDNLMSVVLTLGSPTLAGYSLYLSLLNARWVNDYLFAGIDYPSATIRQSVVRALNSLQQVPIRIHPGESARFESLVVHPSNDAWWNTLAAELDYSHTWSIASATSITWVVVAYLLTVADSLVNVEENIDSNGQGTGSVWLWLLPIVVGWLVLSPKCDYKRVRDAYDKANKQAFVADAHDPRAPALVLSNFGLTIEPSPDWKLYRRNVVSPDESRNPPVFNYARTLPWCRTAYVTSLYYRSAWRKWTRRVGVDGRRIPANVRSDVPSEESRVGDRSQTIRYCRPDAHEYPGPDILWPPGVISNMIMASLMSLQLQWGTTGAAILVVYFTPTVGIGCRSLAYLMYGTLSTVVWIVLVASSVLGYYAHHLIDDFPTPDLESEGQEILHDFTPGSINTNDRSEFAESTPLQEFKVPHISKVAAERLGMSSESDGESYEPSSVTTIKRTRGGRIRARTIAQVADWLRWIGKFIAVINATGIIANSVFQYATVYDNCYCDSSVYTWGSSAFNVIMPTVSDTHLAIHAWIGALGLALTCCGFFVGTIYLMRDSLPS